MFSFVTRFLLYFVVFRKLLSQTFAHTFWSTQQNLSWSFLYTIKKIIFEKYILDIEKIFIKDLNYFVGHPVYKKAF